MINRSLLSRRDRASAWWSTRWWTRKPHAAFAHKIAWRRVVYFRQPFPWRITSSCSAASCYLRLLSCLRYPSTWSPSSCLLARFPVIPQKPWHHSPAPPSTLPPLFSSWCFPGFVDPERDSYHVCVWRARESLDCTRGTIDPHAHSSDTSVDLTELFFPSRTVAKESLNSSRCSVIPSPPPPLLVAFLLFPLPLSSFRPTLNQ